MVRQRVIAPCLVILLAASCIAQQHQHGNGEKLGAVHFATSCNQAAQQEFDRAVALLHSFQFSRAIAEFNSALKSDPTCGIAHWGIALSQWSNPFAAGLKDQSQLRLGRESANRGKLVGAKTERERAYITAVARLYDNFEGTPQRASLLAYRDATEEVAARYPGDDEAQIFYALALAASEELTDKTYSARLKAGAILEKLFEQEPDHPGLAHYIIHTYDVPALAPRALKAARRYSEIAPDAPHALHMPSHTFTRTGYWQDSIDSNVASAAAAKRESQTAEELHSTDYLIYAYLQTGQDEAARHLLDSLPEIASRFDPKAVIGGAGGPSAGYFALAAIPARYALERQQWRDALQLTPRETPFPYTEAMTWFARGLAAARLGQAPVARQSVDALTQIRERLSKGSENYWAQQVEIEEIEIRAWAALADGKKDEALRQMKSAAELEDGTEKRTVGQSLAFRISGEGTLRARVESGGSQREGALAKSENRPGGGPGPPIDAPDPLQKYRWQILAGIAGAFITTATYISLRQRAGARGASRAEAQALRTEGQDLDYGVGEAPKQISKPVHMAIAQPSVKDSPSSVLLEGLKEELFQLEVEHLQGDISQQEYEKTKVALDQTLERALKRER